MQHMHQEMMNSQRPLSKQPIPLHAKRVFKGIMFYRLQQDPQKLEQVREMFFNK